MAAILLFQPYFEKGASHGTLISLSLSIFVIWGQEPCTSWGDCEGYTKNNNCKVFGTVSILIVVVVVIIYLSKLIKLYLFIFLATQLVGSSFPDQGLNPGPQQ